MHGVLEQIFATLHRWIIAYENVGQCTERAKEKNGGGGGGQKQEQL